MNHRLSRSTRISAIGLLSAGLTVVAIGTASAPGAASPSNGFGTRHIAVTGPVASRSEQTVAPSVLGVHVPKRSKGFDPFTANPRQLRQNGYPPKPKNHAFVAAWVRRVREAEEYTYVPPTFTVLYDRPGSPAPVGSSESSDAPPSSCIANVSGVHNDRWAGYVDTDDSFYGATMTWNVPTPYPPSYRTPAESSIWPGIGAGNSDSDELIQAGTEQDVDETGDLMSYYFWYQIVPHDEYQIEVSLPVTAGDNVTAVVAVNTQEGGPAYFYLYNSTEGLYTDFNVTYPGSTGQQADFIVERTLEGGSLPSLPFFQEDEGGSVGISDAIWYDSTTEGGVGQLSHLYYTMWTSDSGGTRLAYTGGIIPPECTNFPVYRTNDN